MTILPERAIGSVLTPVTDKVRVGEEESYRLSGVFSFGKGLIERGVIKGGDTSYTHLRRLTTGQMVMSKLNAWEGALAVVDESFAGTYVSPEYPVFDINRTLADPQYIGYLVTWPSLWSKLTPRGSMVRRKRTSPETLLSTHVPLPNLPHQRRIAARLGAILNRVDAVKGLRRKSADLADGLREALVRTAAESAATTARVGDLLTFERTPITIDPDETYRVVGVRSFGRGFIYHPPTKGDDLSKLNYYQFPADALALSNLMAWEGGITVSHASDTEYIASNRFLFYVPTEEGRVNVRFLRHFFLTRQGLALIGSACSSGAERNRTLGRSRFESLKIPLPPRDEQERMAKILDSLYDRVGKVHADPPLDALRPSILNAAFTGRL